MVLKKGDLVRGKKPWNEGTILGIILKERKLQTLGAVSSFKIHWINSEENLMTSKPSYVTWEVAGSVEKIRNEC